VLAGEAMEGGPLMLAWSELAPDPAELMAAESVYNVVIHEFAHQLDQEKGHANGAPLLASKAAYARWSEVMQGEFDALRARAEAGVPSLMSDYGATDPAEFFAVASEVFFERPAELAGWHPALYAELSRYYRLNPHSWQ